MIKHSRVVPATLFVIFLVLANPGDARRLPTSAFEPQDADRAALVELLQIDDRQIVSLTGFRIVFGDGELSTPRAVVRVADERLAAGVQAGRQMTCYVADDAWRCPEESLLEMLFADLPETCDVEVVPEGTGAFISMLRQDLSLEEAVAITDVICTSETIDTGAWQQGHRVQGVRRGPDGDLQILTVSPRDPETGFVFVLEEVCAEDLCRLVVKDRYAWMT